MVRMSTHVRLSHAHVIRTYYGSHAGWSAETSFRHVGDPLLITGNKPMRLVCTAPSCQARLIFRLLSHEERTRTFRRNLGRRLLILGAAQLMVIVSAPLAFGNHGPALTIIGSVMYAPSLFISLVVLALLFFRPTRYELKYEPPSSELRSGSFSVQHGVELS